MKRALVTLALAALLSTGCWPRKKKPAVVAPPPPQPAEQSRPAPPKETPAPAPPARPRAARPRSPAPAPAPAEAKPAAVPPPQLGPLIPSDRQKQLEAAYAVDLKQARAVLTAKGQAKLDPAGAEMVARIHAFIRQAEEFHNRDLAAAAEFAQRARVLAQDLDARSK